MTEFYKDLADLLFKYRVSIIARVNECDDAQIGFQSDYCDNYWTDRHHITAYDLKCEIEKQGDER